MISQERLDMLIKHFLNTGQVIDFQDFDEMCKLVYEKLGEKRITFLAKDTKSIFCFHFIAKHFKNKHVLHPDFVTHILFNNKEKQRSKYDYKLIYQTLCPNKRITMEYIDSFVDFALFKVEDSLETTQNITELENKLNEIVQGNVLFYNKEIQIKEVFNYFEKINILPLLIKHKQEQKAMFLFDIDDVVKELKMGAISKEDYESYVARHEKKSNGVKMKVI